MVYKFIKGIQVGNAVVKAGVGVFLVFPFTPLK